MDEIIRACIAVGKFIFYPFYLAFKITECCRDSGAGDVLNSVASAASGTAHVVEKGVKIGVPLSADIAARSAEHAMGAAGHIAANVAKAGAHAIVDQPLGMHHQHGHGIDRPVVIGACDPWIINPMMQPGYNNGAYLGGSGTYQPPIQQQPVTQQAQPPYIEPTRSPQVAYQLQQIEIALRHAQQRPGYDPTRPLEITLPNTLDFNLQQRLHEIVCNKLGISALISIQNRSDIPARPTDDNAAIAKIRKDLHAYKSATGYNPSMPLQFTAPDKKSQDMHLQVCKEFGMAAEIGNAKRSYAQPISTDRNSLVGYYERAQVNISDLAGGNPGRRR